MCGGSSNGDAPSMRSRSRRKPQKTAHGPAKEPISPDSSEGVARNAARGTVDGLAGDSAADVRVGSSLDLRGSDDPEESATKHGGGTRGMVKMVSRPTGASFRRGKKYPKEGEALGGAHRIDGENRNPDIKKSSPRRKHTRADRNSGSPRRGVDDGIGKIRGGRKARQLSGFDHRGSVTAGTALPSVGKALEGRENRLESAHSANKGYPTAVGDRIMIRPTRLPS